MSAAVRGLLEERIEGGARVLRRRRRLLGGELLPLSRLEVNALVRLRLLHHQRHLRLAALRRRAGIEVRAVRAGMQIGTAGGAARREPGSGADALQLAAARAAEGARGRRAQSAPAGRIARIPRAARSAGAASGTGRPVALLPVGAAAR